MFSSVLVTKFGGDFGKRQYLNSLSPMKALGKNLISVLFEKYFLRFLFQNEFNFKIIISTFPQNHFFERFFCGTNYFALHNYFLTKSVFKVFCYFKFNYILD